MIPKLEYGKAKVALEASAKVLETMNVIYFIDQGTVLGAVREGGFLKDDHDIDMGFFMGSYRKEEMLEILLGAGFTVEWLLDTPDHLSPQYSMWYKGVRVDFSCFCHDLLLEKVWHYSYLPLVSYARNVFPARLFNVMETVKLADGSYPAPSPVEEYLERRYGNWKMRQKRWDYMRDPPCVTDWWAWYDLPTPLMVQGQG